MSIQMGEMIQPNYHASIHRKCTWQKFLLACLKAFALYSNQSTIIGCTYNILSVRVVSGVFSEQKKKKTSTNKPMVNKCASTNVNANYVK